MTGPKDTVATIIPALRYPDSNAALEWLCRAFGFSRRAAYTDDAGIVVHAELAFGNGMIMLGPAADTPFGRFVRLPAEIGGVETQTPYLVVADPDAHHARAVAAGAEILLPLRDESYGGREYSCRDPWGHVWTFGTYDPWAVPAGTTGAASP